MANGKPGKPAKHSVEFKREAADCHLSVGRTQRGCTDDLGVLCRTIARDLRGTPAPTVSNPNCHIQRYVI